MRCETGPKTTATRNCGIQPMPDRTRIGKQRSSAVENSGNVECIIVLLFHHAYCNDLLCVGQALRLLPPNLIIPLPELVVTPYVPVPDTNGEEWDRLEPASALDALVELALHGEYNGLFGAKAIAGGP